jgi:DNA-3-methyladenine glycosylase II
MMKLYSANGQLKPKPPFDFEQSLDLIGGFPPMGGEQTLGPRTLGKTVSLQGRPVVFDLESAGTVEAPALQYTLFAAQPIDQQRVRLAADRISFFLSLDDDLKPFYELGLEDAAFAPVVRRLYGLHQVKFLTPFEIVCWAVLNRRVPLAVAKRMKQALVERYGGCIDVNGTPHRAFPEPTQLVAATVSELKALIRNEQKAGYLHAVVQAFADVDEAWLRYGDYDQVQQWLLAIKGIGEWSAHFIMLRGLGRMERLESTRSAAYENKLTEAVSKVYAPGRLLDNAEISLLAGRYGEWKGYWVYYLRTAA